MAMSVQSAALIFSLVSIAASTAFGQPVFISRAWQDQGNVTTITFASPRAFFVVPTTGAPFSADRVSEHTQILADGTLHSRPTTVEHVVHDSQGRTRTERAPFPAMALASDQSPPDFRVTEIIDPVPGFAYMLDDANKSIHRIPMRPPAPRTAARGSVVFGGPQRVVEQLGIKSIEGFLAQGTRRISTLSADSQANGLPIVQTNESWYLPELKMMVVLTSNDPRNGEHTTKLINIHRGEPDPTLFQTPPGYTVVDEKIRLR
jgi:hypothetical protein